MPRKSRKNPGTSGGAYQNRTDLAQPVQSAPGQAYGQRTAQETAQADVPLAQEQAAMPFDRVLGAAQAHEFQPAPLNAPSNRPYEPVTAGLASGPGPGPEVMGSTKQLSNLLARAAMETGNETLNAMAELAKRQGL